MNAATLSSSGSGRSRRPALVAMAVVVVLCLLALRSRYTVEDSNAIPQRNTNTVAGPTTTEPTTAEKQTSEKLSAPQTSRTESVSSSAPQTPGSTSEVTTAQSPLPSTTGIAPFSRPNNNSPVDVPLTTVAVSPPPEPPLASTNEASPTTVVPAQSTELLTPDTTSSPPITTGLSWVFDIPATPTASFVTTSDAPSSTTTTEIKPEVATTSIVTAAGGSALVTNPPLTEAAPTTTFATSAQTSPAPNYVKGFYVNPNFHLVCNWEKKDSEWLGSSWGVVGTTVDCSNTAYVENYRSDDQCRLAPDCNITDVVFQVWPERPFSLAVALGISNGTATPLLIRRSNKLFMHWDQQHYDPWGVRRHLQSSTNDVMVPFRSGDSLAHLEKNSEPMEALYQRHPVVFYALETWLHFPSHTTEDYLDLLWYYLGRGLEKAKIPWLIPDAGTTRVYYSIVTFFSKLYGFEFVMIRPELIHRFRGTVIFPPVYHASVCGSIDTGLRLADNTVAAKNASMNGTLRLHRGTCTVKLTGKVASATGSAGVAGGEPFLNLLSKAGITFLDGKESWEDKITTIHTGDLLICSWGASCFLNMIFRPKRLLVILSSGYQAEWLRVLQVRFGENQTSWPTNFVHSFTDVPAGGYYHARYIRTDNVDILTEDDLNF